MELLDGKKLSRRIKAEIKEEVESYLDKGMRPPHLVAVLVGDDPASRYYVKSKMRSCKEVGIKSTNINLDSAIGESRLLEIINSLNEDENIDGYIVQLPLPAHLDVNKILTAISPAKDVDGFHPQNLGRLMLGLDTFVPATPLGIMEMLKRYDITTAGKDVAILGRSNIVGKPMSILLSGKGYPGDSTVTVLHSKSKNIESKLKNADIIIAAMGKAAFVKASMVKKGVVIIDVGINRVEDKSVEKGYKIIGDVDFDNVAPLCSYITPVPGGVGLMTVTALLMNTLKAYKKRYDV